MVPYYLQKSLNSQTIHHLFFVKPGVFVLSKPPSPPSGGPAPTDVSLGRCQYSWNTQKISSGFFHDTMEPQLAGTRRKRESILAGGRRIQKVRSRSSSRGPGSRQSEPLLEFLDDILNFSKVLLRQQTNPLREDLVLGQIIYLENLQAYDSHPMTSETESVGTINIDTSSTSSENWTTSCLAIKAELNRLVMWKFDITQKRLSAAFKEESLLYTVLCETILGIGETIKSRKFTYCFYKITVITN